VFDDADKSELSCIIVDDIEKLLGKRMILNSLFGNKEVQI
jgi:SpoVK/Ycf46/Vps4 family AAA+-type ATPase